MESAEAAAAEAGEAATMVEGKVVFSTSHDPTFPPTAILDGSVPFCSALSWFVIAAIPYSIIRVLSVLKGMWESWHIGGLGNPPNFARQQTTSVL